MTDAEHLADLRERFGPNATRVGDPPTAGDVALLLRLLDQPKCVDDAKVAEIRDRHKQFKKHADSYRHSYSDTDYRRFTLADIDTLLAALDAERDAVVAWLRRLAAQYRNSLFFEAGIDMPAIQDEERAYAIERGEHRK